MISLVNLTKTFRDEKAVDNISLDINQGELIGFAGPSGSGKSVLIKIISGLIIPDSGTLLHNGKDIFRSENVDPISTGFSFQEGALFDSMKVIENVAFPIANEDNSGFFTGGFPPESLERAYAILAKVGLAKDCYKFIGELSGGMKKRVAIARALAKNPELALLDEPTGGLDPVTSSVIIELIKSLHKEFNMATIIVSQDVRRLIPNVERVVCLEKGQKVCDCPPSELKDKAPKTMIDFLSHRYDFQ